MMRKMRRFKQQLEDSDALKVLKNGHRGVLSLLGDEGYPYGVPVMMGIFISTVPALVIRSMR